MKFCDPERRIAQEFDFIPQPLGGTSLLEGSVEYRFPLRLTERLRNFVGAVFIDGGIVGSGEIRGLQTVTNIVHGTGAITPGFGIRYQSPVGPIRVDFGINPNRSEELGVVTAVRDSTGATAHRAAGDSRALLAGQDAPQPAHSAFLDRRGVLMADNTLHWRRGILVGLSMILGLALLAVLAVYVVTGTGLGSRPCATRGAEYARDPWCTAT